MTVIVTERFGRRTSGEDSELLYTITGTDSDATALSNMLSTAPTTHASLVRDTDAAEVEEVGASLWLGVVPYRASDNTNGEIVEDVGDSSFSFDTTGGTQHITQSLAQIEQYDFNGANSVAGTAPDFDGAIGVDASGVQGADIIVPVYRFSETHIIAAADVDAAYKGTIFDLTGTVNNATFKGLDAGECLFLGATGQRTGTESTDPWQITFYFAASPNKTGLSVGAITGIAKKGWEYLWVFYKDSVDATQNEYIKVPRAAYVERVYESGTFSGLGI